MEQARRVGGPLPARIRDAPELFLGNELFLIAFMELTSCRGLGYGAVGPIPWMTIHLYCEVHDIVGEQREDLIYFVQHMDRAYMDWQTKKGKEEAAKAAAANKGT